MNGRPEGLRTPGSRRVGNHPDGPPVKGPGGGGLWVPRDFRFAGKRPGRPPANFGYQLGSDCNSRYDGAPHRLKSNPIERARPRVGSPFTSTMSRSSAFSSRTRRVRGHRAGSTLAPTSSAA